MVVAVDIRVVVPVEVAVDDTDEIIVKLAVDVCVVDGEVFSQLKCSPAKFLAMTSFNLVADSSQSLLPNS